MSAHDKRRLELCEAFISNIRAQGSADEERLDELKREAVLAEKEAAVQAIRLRENTADNEAWTVRDAVDAFLHRGILQRLNADNQQALDKVLQPMFADKDVRKAYIRSLVDARGAVKNNDGCIFVAAVEGHPDGIKRFVGYVEYSTAAYQMSASVLDGARSVRLLPRHEMVMQARDNVLITPMLWASYERAEQVYLHGIDSVHPAGRSREEMFAYVCDRKGLCGRCGRLGHHAAVCGAESRADWAALDGSRFF